MHENQVTGDGEAVVEEVKDAVPTEKAPEETVQAAPVTEQIVATEDVVNEASVDAGQAFGFEDVSDKELEREDITEEDDAQVFSADVVGNADASKLYEALAVLYNVSTGVKTRDQGRVYVRENYPDFYEAALGRGNPL